jgi:hypothetical protein
LCWHIWKTIYTKCSLVVKVKKGNCSTLKWLFSFWASTN